MDLLAGEPRVITAGVSLFAEALAGQAVEVDAVDWRPPADPDPDGSLATALARVIADPRRPEADRTAVQRMLASRALLVDVRPAGEALGSGCRHVPARRATAGLGACLRPDARRAPGRDGVRGARRHPRGRRAGAGRIGRAAGSGCAIVLDPCHHHGAVGPMAGVISPSMWVFELEDAGTGRRAWCSLNEGLGKVLRYGAFGPEVIERLRWMSAVLGPLLRGRRAHGARRRRPGRHHRDHRADAADGRRGPQPEPGRHADARCANCSRR